MTDFLARLVARSTAATPLPLPVVAPLFAPGPAIPPGPDAGETDPVGPDPAPGRLPAAPAVFTNLSVRSDQPGLAPALLADPAGRSGPAISTALPRTDSKASATIAAAPARELAVRRREVGKRETSSPAVPAARPPRGDAQLPASSKPPSSVPLVVPPPIFAPAFHPVRRDPLPPTDPQPVIKVSIGRIEVRAVTAPAPPRPAPPPKRSGIVLEEYLKPRGGDR